MKKQAEMIRGLNISKTLVKMVLYHTYCKEVVERASKERYGKITYGKDSSKSGKAFYKTENRGDK